MWRTSAASSCLPAVPGGQSGGVMGLPQPSREDRTPSDLPGLRTPQDGGLRGLRDAAGPWAKLTPRASSQGSPCPRCLLNRPAAAASTQDSTLLALDRASRHQR